MEKMGVGWTSVFDLEASEMRQAASLKNVARMAKAMGCKLVYGIVPENGKTLEWLAEARQWRSVLGEDADEVAGKRVS
jgi:sugar phosphate isomerase/epimerase